MADKTNNSKRTFKRRAVMKSLGAASALGIGTQTVAAWGETEISRGDIAAAQELLDSIEEIDSPFNTSILHRGRTTDSYNELLSAIEADYEHVQITASAAFRIDKLGVYIAKFSLDTRETDHDGEIIIPIDNPRLTTNKKYDEVNLDPGAVMNSYSDGAPAKISKYIQSEHDELSTNGYAGVNEDLVREDVNRLTVDLTTAENEVQIYGDSATCSQCKLALGALNASSCGLGTYFTCSVITAKTIVGPVACAAIVPTICFIVQNYGTNNPDKTCAGEDMFGNDVLPGDLEGFC